MSLVVTVYVPAGIVMAADSRMSMRRMEEREVEGKRVRVEQQIVFSDNANALIALHKVPLGISVYDARVVSNKPIEDQVHKFESDVLAADDDIDAAADKLLTFFQESHPQAPVGFHVAGYRKQGRSHIPVVLVGHTVREPGMRRVNVNDSGDPQYGVVRAGDTSVANRLIDKKSLPLFTAMPLQDAIDYATYLIRTTIETLRFEPRAPTVGGPIDVLVVTPEAVQWVQRKALRGG